MASEGECDEGNTTVEVEVPTEGSEEEVVLEKVDWNEELKSPTEIEGFSPSLGIHRPGCLHGSGLQLVIQRTTKLTKADLQASALLYDVSTFCDSYSQSIQRVSGNLPASSTVSSQLQGTNRSLQTFSQKMQTFASKLRTNVSKPLHSSMQAMTETAPHIHQRYIETRQKAEKTRNQALREREKYLKVVQEADEAIIKLQRAKDAAQMGTEQSTIPNYIQGASVLNTPSSKPWELKLKNFSRKYGVGADRVIVLLNEVQALETSYKNLVQMENRAVSESEAMETMALQTIQELENQRIDFFAEAMKLALQIENETFGKVTDPDTISEEHDTAVKTPPASTLKGKQKTEFFKNLLKPGSTQGDDDEIGGMEAETLGLPEEIGLLRDDLKAKIRARNRRIQVAKGLSLCLEDIAASSVNLATGLSSRLNQDGFNAKKVKPRDSLSFVLQDAEGQRMVAVWDSLVMTFLTLADAARAMADGFRATRHEHFDNFLLRAEREVKAVNDGDDLRWKYLCEAARTENRAEMKHQQSSTQSEKARERIQSFEGQNGRERTNSQGPKITAGMSKAIGNVFSILPNGGEKAMKMMTPDARRVVAQSTLDESSQRESKDKQALAAASVVKSQAIRSYESAAKKMVETLERDDETGWRDIASSIESFVTAIDTFEKTFLDTVSAIEKSHVLAEERQADLLEFTKQTKEQVMLKMQQRSSAIPDEDYQLLFKPAHSRKVTRLLAMVGTDDDDLELCKDDDSQDLDDSLHSYSSPENSPLKSDSGISREMPSPKRFNGSTDMDNFSGSTKELMSLADDLRERSEGDVVEKTNLAVNQAAMKGLDSPMVGLARFLPEKDSKGNGIEIVDSFSCIYWPKETEGYMSRLIQGRMYATNTTLFVVGWDGKKLFFEWETIVDLSKARSLNDEEDDAIRVSLSDNSYFFGKIANRDKVFDVLDNLCAEAAKKSLEEKERAEKERKAKEEKERKAKEEEAEKSKTREVTVPLNGNIQSSTSVPPDQTLEKMNTLLTRTLKNVSVKTFYEVAWSDGQDTSAEKLYKPWLEELGSYNVETSDWTMEEHKNGWCQETYSQFRKVRFEFKRTTHLYVGPPTAIVNQKHHCRVDGNDRCVLQMTVEMEGIPYADCFAVEVRWVATRVGSSDLQIKVGVHVDFKKSTMFAKQIKSGTLVETKPIHSQLFERIKRSLPETSDSAEEDESHDEELAEDCGEEESSGLSFMGFSLGDAKKQVESLVNKASEGDHISIAALLLGAYVSFWFITRLFGLVLFNRNEMKGQESTMDISQLASKMDVLEAEMKEMHETLNAMKEILLQRASHE